MLYLMLLILGECFASPGGSQQGQEDQVLRGRVLRGPPGPADPKQLHGSVDLHHDLHDS